MENQMKVCIYRLLLALMIIAGLQRGAVADEPAPLKVLTTLSTFKSLVEEVGGEYVEVTAIAPPQFNAHFIEPRPSDVLRLKRADLFVHGGLDLEAWRSPLVQAAARRDIMPGGPLELDLSRGVNLLQVPREPVSRVQGDIHLYGNPHYWQSPANALVMADAIAKKLGELQPTRAAYFTQRANEFRRKLEVKMISWQTSSKSAQVQKLVGYHNEWVYLTSFLGVEMKEFIEPKPGIPPSPRHLDHVERYIKENQVKVIAQATFYPDRAANLLADRTGANVAKLCQNVQELPECSDYIATLDYNVQTLLKTGRE